jgi:hypothetical protein
MARETRDRWVDWKIWYEEHKNDGRDLAQTVKFQQKMIEGLLEIVGLMLRDQKESSLFIPSGIHFHE